MCKLSRKLNATNRLDVAEVDYHHVAFACAMVTVCNLQITNRDREE